MPPGHELDFLHPLPVERLWGVGAVTAAKLHTRGLRTVGQVAQLEASTLVALLGQASGRHLHALAHNRDPRPVRVGRRRGSIGSQRALGRKRRSLEEVDAILHRARRPGHRPDAGGRTHRPNSRAAASLRRLLTGDALAHPAVGDRREPARPRSPPASSLAGVVPTIERRGLTLIGLSVANLETAPPVQLPLPFDRHAGGALDAAVDEVRTRFGREAITRAVLLGRDRGL